ncbi:MFS transporter [Leifsonia sp. TF02-11]|uniref:MFS transporter n=1 Tax=Leifsonia sp. TF02-11 TaxID=2815212 RepID=UPI001AA18215|nr:MFS transporter [Leifsonia sp. TF02-11]MBO1739414.1 MFS transporter [Leifsonia sp. TF02-11]
MTLRSPITLLAIGHACVDVFQGAVAALVPFFVAERHYSYALAAGIVLAASLLSSVAQPLFGLLTDRRALPWLLPAATILSGLGIGLSGLAHDYALTLVFVAVSGLGVAAYHPESARLVRVASRGSHVGMAWFATGGNVGFALAPLLVGSTVGALGLSWTPVVALPALVGASLAVPVLRMLARRGDTAEAADSARMTDDVRSFLRLTVVIMTRSIAFVGLGAFIASHAEQRLPGWPGVGTIALTILYLGGIVGSVLGGYFARRWGRVGVSAVSNLVTLVAIAGVVWVPGPALLVFAAATSIGLYVPFSLQVTLGQDYLPSRVGTASGITLGLAVSVGGVATPLIGVLADAAGLQLALATLVTMPVLGFAVLCTLRDPARRPVTEEATAVAA